MIKVKIANTQEKVTLDFARLRETATRVLDGERIAEAKVTLAFVDNPTIHRLNKQFLQHDEPTDVLSFPLSGAGARVLEGEVVIGVEVAESQALERGHDLHAETALYAIHGLLHLCGYDDDTPKNRKAMRERERHYLAVMQLPDIAELT
jgi:probable rRNA maturation factor